MFNLLSFYISHVYSQFVVIHTIKGFSIVNEAEVDILLEFSCFFYDPTDVVNLIFDSFDFSISSLYIWKFSIHILLKTSLKDFEHYFAAAAKSLQSCLTLCDPIDGSPPGSPSLGFSRQEHWSGLPFPSPMHESEKRKWSCSVMSDSVQPHRRQPTSLPRPWDSPRKNTGVGWDTKHLLF